MSDESRSDVPTVTVEIPRFTKYDEGLQDSFAKDVAAQVNRMEDLAKQLITLNLAIPALYGAVLQLTHGADTTRLDPTIIIGFVCWLVSLGLALMALVPVKDQVDPDNTQAIEHYFTRNAKRKLRLVFPASLITFFGICLVIFGFML